jgi:hypothetical protein
MRTVTEYRVLSKRQDTAVKDKRFRSLKAVRDRVGLLLSDEPWRFFGSAGERTRDGDGLYCCPGTQHYECGCGGLTVREHALAPRENLPPIEWVRVEKRQVTTTEWEARETPPLESAQAVDAVGRPSNHVRTPTRA